MYAYLIVFAGAGLGGALRHGVNMAALRMFGPGFPIATLAVNVLGSFLMGVLFALFSLKVDVPAGLRLFLTTGVLGGFTTFSAFSLDAALLYEQGQGVLALIYVLASVILALTGLFLGMGAARYLA